MATLRAMGTGSITPHNGGFRARLPAAHGRRTVGIFATEAEAARALAEEMKRLAGVPTPRGVLLGAYGVRVLAERAASGHYKVASVAKDAARWRVYVEADVIAQVPVVDVDAGDVRQWMKRLLTRGLSASTVTNALTTLRAVCRRALEDGLRRGDPTADVRLPKGARARTDAGWDWLRADEVLALGAALDERVDESPLRLRVRRQAARAIITTAVYTGLRAGELFGLPWDRVDLRAGRLEVHWSYDVAPKAGLRQVSLLAPAREALDRWREESAHLRSRRELVFPAHDGGCHAEGFDAGLRDALSAAGVTRRVRFHDLRHTCASHLLQGTWSPEHIDRRLRLEEVRDWLGHTDIEVTQRYAHLSADAVHELVRPAPQAAEPGHDLDTKVALPARIERAANGLGRRARHAETPSARAVLGSVSRWVSSDEILALVARGRRLAAERDPMLWPLVAELFDVLEREAAPAACKSESA